MNEDARKLMGQRIRAKRDELQLSQDKLAEKLNMKRTNIANYEAGRVIPPGNVLAEMAAIFNTSSDYLLGISNDPSSSEPTEMPLIPEEFTDPEKAREYVNSHQIFGSNGFDADRLDDDQILAFANELLKQMELLSYKYKR